MFKKNSHLLTLMIFSPPMALAGSLNPPAGPNDPASAMYNTQAICNRLDSGAAGSKQAFTQPTSGPADSSRCTLNEIMDKTPAVDDTNGATPAQVLDGKKFWGLQSGHWGTQTGTLATQTPSDTTVNQPAGNYNAFDLSTVDTDLTAGNIKSGVTIFGIEGTYAGGGGSATVAKTGQTTMYTAGDDGDLEKGTTWPNPRFTDNGNGTVTDNLTGLIWLKNANCANAQRNWTTALSDVTQLNTNGTMNGNNCGDTSNSGSHQTDWRLPNRNELNSLIDAEYYDPALSNAAGTAKWSEGDAFSGVQSNIYWSSTTNADNTSYAWYVILIYGIVNYNGKGGSYYVWPLRGGV